MSGKLYSQKDSFHGFKAQIAAKYSKNALAVEPTSKPLDVKKFPFNKLPAFEGEGGLLLNDSHAIAYYVANDQLRGQDLAQRAQVLQWMNFAEGELYHEVSTYAYPLLGLLDAEEKSVKKAEANTKALLKRLNDYLLNNTYLVGERITLADICVCCNLLSLYTKVMCPAGRKDYGNVERYFTTLVNQPEFKEVLGEVKLCEEAPKLQPKKKEQPKAAKQEKPKPAAEPADDAGDEPPKEKEKDPFAAFPKGTFDLDDFKRFYSNNDVDKSVPYFWEKFDPEHYSIWHCEYLYPDELALTFMSCNLISGMFQRLDKLNKHAFASMLLFGEDNKSTISGIWIWRSHELAFTLSDNWQIDYQSYKWTKLDPAKEETKKMVNEYLSWEGDFNGQKVNQGKIFK